MPTIFFSLLLLAGITILPAATFSLTRSAESPSSSATCSDLFSTSAFAPFQLCHFSHPLKYKNPQDENALRIAPWLIHPRFRPREGFIRIQIYDSALQAGLLAPGSYPICDFWAPTRRPSRSFLSGFIGFCPRLQRRDRSRIGTYPLSRDSLLRPWHLTLYNLQNSGVNVKFGKTGSPLAVFDHVVTLHCPAETFSYVRSAGKIFFVRCKGTNPGSGSMVK